MARKRILLSEGILSLDHEGEDESRALLNYLLQVEHAGVPDVIEAMAFAFADRTTQADSLIYGRAPLFHNLVNDLLSGHRISFELIDGRMVEFASRELHVSVTAPTLALLGGLPNAHLVEKAYQDALEEISGGRPGDAITDAGTALQGALVLLGCKGSALGQLIKSARAKGLLAAHDVPMLDQFVKTLEWVSADRSQKGDAHTAHEPTREDAWLTVHIVGALVLRLLGPAEGRGT